MDCERFDRNSMNLLYGELDELSEAATLRHLHHCTRCREIWGHLRTTREIAQPPQIEPPNDLAARIIAAEREAHRNLPLRERFSRTVSVLAGYAMRPQLAMAALLVLMVGSGLIFVRARPTSGNSDGMRVVERGMPSVDHPEKPQTDEMLVFGGEPDPLMEGSVEEQAAAGSEDDIHSVTPADEHRRREHAAYGDAMAAYQQGRYAEAERLFSEVASTGGEQAASAALHEGHAARNGSGCQRAAAIYDSVAQRQGATTIGDEASWHAASCYRAMGHTAQALSHYRKLSSRGAFSERAKQALTELSPTNPDQQTEQDVAAAQESATKSAAKPKAVESKPGVAIDPAVSQQPARAESANSDDAQ